MKISAQSRYAIIGLIELASKEGQTVSIREISNRHHIPLTYLEKIFQKLRLSGVVKASRGKDGGYFLNRPSHQITLYELMQSLDESMDMNACRQKGGCTSPKPCLAHYFLGYISQEIQNLFDQLTLKDVLINHSTNQIKNSLLT